MTNNDGDRIRILDCAWIQGNVYTVGGEDGLLYVADTFFVATGADDARYILDSHRIPGFGRDEDGFAHPNRSYRTEADDFAARVARRGSIDPALWSPYVEMTHAERDAYNLRCEQDERAWEGA